MSLPGIPDYEQFMREIALFTDEEIREKLKMRLWFGKQAEWARDELEQRRAKVEARENAHDRREDRRDRKATIALVISALALLLSAAAVYHTYKAQALTPAPAKAPSSGKPVK